MANKIVYEDYAVGAIDYAYVDLTTSDHQTQTVDGETVDPYHVECIFGNGANEYAAFDVNGFDTYYSARVFTEGEIENGEVVGGDELGYVSDRISNYDRTFTSNPKLVIKFSDDKSFSGSGIGIYFSRYYCTKVNVRYILYDDSYTSAEQYTINEKYAFLPKIVQAYKGIEIEFVETEQPNQYVIVRKIEFGHTVEITKFRSISFNKKIDFYCSDVPINTMDATFIYDGELTFYNNQKLLLYHNNDLIGTYWVAESEKQTDKIYSVTAEDAFSRLEVTASNPFFIVDRINWQTISDILSQYSTLITVTGDTSKYVAGYCKKGSLRKMLAEAMFAFQKKAKSMPDGTILVSDLESNIPVYEFDENKESLIIGNSFYKNVVPISSVSIKSKKYNDLFYNTDSSFTIEEGVSIGATAVYVETDIPTKTIGLSDSNGNIIDIRDGQGGFSYGVNIIDNFHFAIWSSTTTYSNVNIVGSACDYVDTSFSQSRSLPVGSKEFVKDFGTRSLYRKIDTNDWIESVSNRAFSVNGEVTAKIILSNTEVENEEENKTTVTKYLDVGDYVSIKTAYSGTKRGTITEIDADVGENDIVGNVVITVWE